MFNVLKNPCSIGPAALLEPRREGRVEYRGFAHLHFTDTMVGI